GALGMGDFFNIRKPVPPGGTGGRTIFANLPSSVARPAKRNGLVVLLVAHYPRATLRSALGHTLAPA
ncbi:MAG TPA: hypothetical protein VGL91_06720, partial [Acidobacteriota bacterium]